MKRKEDNRNFFYFKKAFWSEYVNKKFQVTEDNGILIYQEAGKGLRLRKASNDMKTVLLPKGYEAEKIKVVLYEKKFAVIKIKCWQNITFNV